ncbi:MAG: hypothetical protein ACOC71_03405 [Hyphomicrobiales bacterium]
MADQMGKARQDALTMADIWERLALETERAGKIRATQPASQAGASSAMDPRRRLLMAA